MNYQFYKKRFIFYGISVAIITIGIVVSFIAGIKLDIQFQGGSIVRYSYVGTIDNAKVLAAAEKAIGVEISSIQENQNATTKSIAINVAGREALTVAQTSALRASLTSVEFKDYKFTFYDATLVSPSIGAEYLQRGIYALLIASILIILYIWYRFRSMSTGPSAGFTALLALFHDVIIVFVAFVIFRIPLNESLIAVALTIIGYSTNDTIVIYDRIRENIRLENGKMALSDLVDKSINQSMTRSINTSAATFGAVTVAYVFAAIYGINSIQSFALPMMVGILTGFYSTVFIASPLWVDWKTRGARTGI